MNDIDSLVRDLNTAIAARNKAAIEDACFELECTQMESETWAPEVFAVFSRLLKDKDACAVDGSSALVLSLYNDFEKLTKEQSSSLLEVFDENADNYGDEILRHSVSDLVARKYPSDVALDMFSKWQRSDSPRRLHMAQVGLEVLIMARRLVPDVEKAVRTKLQEVLRRRGG